jgi:hypothetical protein
MQNLRKIISKIAGILCIIIVVVFCLVLVYDLFSPWPIASRSLETFGNHYRFCIGMGNDFSMTISNGRAVIESSRQRVFILMRAPIDWPRLVTVYQDQDGLVVITESVYEFWIGLLVIGGILLGAWHWGLRPLFYKTS